MAPLFQIKTLCHLILMWIVLMSEFKGSKSNIIRYHPNTLLEFKSLKCQGEYNREQYSVLNQVCDECYNLSRQQGVYSECRANCFRNPLFSMCVSFLILDYRQDEITKIINSVNGGM